MIQFIVTDVETGVNKIFTLVKSGALVWSSSNPGFVSVSDTGLVTAESVGTATVIVTAVDGGDQARCTVRVGLSSTIVYVKANAAGLGNGTSWKHAFIPTAQ